MAGAAAILCTIVAEAGTAADRNQREDQYYRKDDGEEESGSEEDKEDRSLRLRSTSHHHQMARPASPSLNELLITKQSNRNTAHHAAPHSHHSPHSPHSPHSSTRSPHRVGMVVASSTHSATHSTAREGTEDAGGVEQTAKENDENCNGGNDGKDNRTTHTAATNHNTAATTAESMGGVRVLARKVKSNPRGKRITGYACKLTLPKPSCNFQEFMERPAQQERRTLQHRELFYQESVRRITAHNKKTTQGGAVQSPTLSLHTPTSATCSKAFSDAFSDTAVGKDKQILEQLIQSGEKNLRRSSTTALLNHRQPPILRTTVGKKDGCLKERLQFHRRVASGQKLLVSSSIRSPHHGKSGRF
jgi:hypothetical protein